MHHYDINTVRRNTQAAAQRSEGRDEAAQQVSEMLSRARLKDAVTDRIMAAGNLGRTRARMEAEKVLCYTLRPVPLKHGWEEVVGGLL